MIATRNFLCYGRYVYDIDLALSTDNNSSLFLNNTLSFVKYAMVINQRCHLQITLEHA